MKYSKIVLFTLIALVISDFFKYLSWVGGLNFDNSTSISSLLNYTSIFIMVFIASESKWNDEIPNTIKNWFKLWMFWNIINLLRGALLAADYWDWKMLFLSSFFFSLIPLAFFLGKNLDIVATIFKFVLKYLFPLGFLFIPLTLATNEELYSRLMIPISLFILFIPFLKFKWKFLIIVVAATSLLMVIGFRSNIIKIAFSVILLMVYYFREYLRKSWLKLVQLILFLIPLVLLSLAITDQYNVFERTSTEVGYSSINSKGEEENLMADTRTGLYVDVFNSLNNSSDWLFGKSAIASYESEMFFDTGGAINGKRYGCEVGILNILLRNGLIGVTCYFLLLFTVSGYAIKYSSNILAKMMGLFIAFRWAYSFVEEFTQYDLNFYFFWIAIGLVSSVQFRDMTDKEIRIFFELQ